MEKVDYYETLGVSREADGKELKSAFRKLAMKFHPDRNPDNPDAEQNFKELNEAAPKRQRRVRCWSCKTMIELTDTVLAFPRFRVPEYDVEIEIYGEDGEIAIATKYQCETCGGLYLSLKALGFCVAPYNDQRDLIEQHRIMKARTSAPGALEYINKTYDTTWALDQRVTYGGERGDHLGTIVNATGHYLKIRLDGQNNAGLYHPTWKLKAVAL